MRRGGLRPLAYLRSKFLQTDGGLCHPALASLLCSDCLRQGPFALRALPRFLAHTDPSVRLSPSPHFAFRLARLPCFRGLSPRGEEPFPVFSHDLERVLPSFTPPGGASPDRVWSHLLPSPLLGQLGTRVFCISRPCPDVHSSLRPAPFLTPPCGALSVGFAARISHVGATQAMRLRSSTASGLSPYGFMGTSRHHQAVAADNPAAGTSCRIETPTRRRACS